MLYHNKGLPTEFVKTLLKKPERTKHSLKHSWLWIISNPWAHPTSHGSYTFDVLWNPSQCNSQCWLCTKVVGSWSRAYNLQWHRYRSMIVAWKLPCKFVDRKTCSLRGVIFRRIFMSPALDPRQPICHQHFSFSNYSWPLRCPYVIMIQHFHPCATRTSNHTLQSSSFQPIPNGA